MRLKKFKQTIMSRSASSNRAASSNRWVPRDLPFGVVHDRVAGKTIVTGVTVDPNAADWTAYVWCRYDGILTDLSGIDVTLFSNDNGTGLGRNILYIDAGSGGKWEVKSDGSSHNSGVLATEGKMELATITHKKSAQTIDVYIDAILIDHITSITPNSASGAWNIGAGKAAGYAGPWDGPTSGFRFFTEHHDADTVMDYFQRNTFDDTNLLNELPYSDGSGPTITATVGPNATIVGGLGWTEDTGIKLRSAAPVFRVPVALRDLGVEHLYGMRNGFIGNDKPVVKDLIGKHHCRYRGATAIGTVYTDDEYTIDLDRANSDFFASQEVPLATSAITKAFYFGWFNMESLPGNMNVIASWAGLNDRRSVILRVNGNGTIRALLSNNGVAVGSAHDSDAAHISDLATNYFIGFGWDGSGGAAPPQMYFQGLPVDSSLAAGANIASIHPDGAGIQLGANLSGGGSGTNTFNGKLSISGCTVGKTVTDAQMLKIYKITKAINGF